MDTKLLMNNNEKDNMLFGLVLELEAEAEPVVDTYSLEYIPNFQLSADKVSGQFARSQHTQKNQRIQIQKHHNIGKVHMEMERHTS